VKQKFLSRKKVFAGCAVVCFIFILALLLVPQVLKSILKERVFKEVETILSSQKLGKLDYEIESIGIFPSLSVYFRDVSFKIPEQKERLFFAKKLRVGVSPLGALLRRERVSVRVSATGADLNLEYIGKGKFSVTPLLKKILEQRVERKAVSSFRLNLKDASILLTLGADGRKEIDSALELNRKKIGDSIQKELVRLLSRYGISVDGDVLEKAGAVFEEGAIKSPSRIEARISLLASYSADKEVIRGSCALSSPIESKARFEVDTRTLDYSVSGNTFSFEFSALPFRFAPALARMFGKSVFEVGKEFKFSRKDGKRLFQLGVVARQIDLSDFLGEGTSLSEASFAFDDGRSSASGTLMNRLGKRILQFSYGAVISRGSSMFGVSFSDFPLSSFDVSLHSLSANFVSGKLNFDRVGEQESLSVNLNFEKVSKGKLAIADSVNLEGAFSDEARFSLSARSGKKRILFAQGKGNSEKLAYLVVLNSFPSGLLPDAFSSLSRYAPDSLVSGKVNGVIKRSPFLVTGTVDGFASESSKLRLSIKNLSFVVEAEPLTKSSVGRKSITEFSLPSLKRAKISLNSKNIKARTQWALVNVPNLKFSLSPASFALSAETSEVIFFGSNSGRENFANYLPTALKQGLKVDGVLRDGKWEITAESGTTARLKNGSISSSLNGKGKFPGLRLFGFLSGIVEGYPLYADVGIQLEKKSAKVINLEGNFGPGKIKLFGDVSLSPLTMDIAFEARDILVPVLREYLTAEKGITLYGKASGKPLSPRIYGTLEAEKLSVKSAHFPELSKLSFTGVKLPFAYANGTLEFPQGVARIADSSIYAEGKVQNRIANFALSSDSFRMGKFLGKLIARNLSFTGQGRLNGTLGVKEGKGTVQLSYSQEGGAWGKEPLKKASVFATLSEAGLFLRRGEVSLASGSLNFSCRIGAKKKDESRLELSLNRFPVDLLGEVSHLRSFGISGGTASGKLFGRETRGAFLFSGDISLSGSSFYGTRLDTLKANFVEAEDGIKVENLLAFNEDSYLTGSGFWARDPRKTLITLEAPYFDASVFSPFLPKLFLPIEGKLGATLLVTTGADRLPAIEGSFQNATEEGLSVAGIKFERAEGTLAYKAGTLNLKRVLLRSSDSEVRMAGSVAISEKDYPLAIKIESKDFRLQNILRLPFLRSLKGGGKARVDLLFSGTISAPQITGALDVDGENVAFGEILSFPRVELSLKLDNNELVSANGKLYTVFPEGAQEASSYLALDGKGRIRVKPFAFEALDAEVSLDNLRFAELRKYLRGGFGGSLRVSRASLNEPIRVAGKVDIKKGSEMKLSAREIELAEPWLKDVEADILVSAEPTSRLIYPAQAMEVEVEGGVSVRGSLAEPIIEGKFTAPKGSMVVYHHIIRLVEPATISFSPGSGLIPFVSGVAALEIPGGLSSISGVPETMGGRGVIIPGDLASTSLTIFFHFNNLLTEENLNAVQVSSSPPLPQDTIRSILVGGAPGQVTRSGLESFVETEAMLFSASRLSRFLEQALDFSKFEVRALTTPEGTPIYLNVEKNLTEEFSARFLRSFLTTLDERQEFAFKYLLYRSPIHRSVMEVMLRRRPNIPEEFVVGIEAETKF